MNAPSPDNKLKINVYIALFITGAGMGWLIGLSVSPVVGIVITCVTGIATTLIIALSGSGDKKPNWTINPWTIAVFVIGLAVLSPVGVWFRTHNLFGLDEAKLQDKIKASDLEDELQKWETVGISRTVTAERLFNYVYDGNASKELSANLALAPPADGSASVTVGGLAANSTTECILLRSMLAKENVTVQRALELSAVDRWQILASITDTAKLMDMVEKDICPSSRSSAD